MMPDRTPIRGLVASVFVLMLGAAAAAQDAEDAGVLRGPRVEEQRAPSARQPFGEMDRRRAAEQSQALREFMRAIRSLGSDEAPAELRLTPEQSRRIREIVAAQRRLGQGPEPRRAGGRPDEAPRPVDRRAPSDDRPMDEAPTEAERPAQRRGPATDEAWTERWRAMLDAQTRVWSVLTDEQRAHVEGQLELRRPAMEDAMAPSARDGALERPAADARPTTFADEMPPSLRRRLEAMDPARRRALWERLDRALQERGDAPAPRPRPSIDELRVPDPAPAG